MYSILCNLMISYSLTIIDIHEFAISANFTQFVKHKIHFDERFQGLQFLIREAEKKIFS